MVAQGLPILQTLTHNTPKKMETVIDTIPQPLADAIMQGQTIRLCYQDNPRHVIPLVYGRLKNGKDALCYKLDVLPDGSITQSIRLYHASKISDIETTGQHLPYSRRIDYFLTRHFRRVYIQI
jgi:hypothetical protein